MRNLVDRQDPRRDIFAGKWLQLQGAVRERWGDLTEDDLSRVGGKRDQFIGLLQEKYGYSRHRANQMLDDFLEAYQDKKDQMTPGPDTSNSRSVLALLTAVAFISAGIIAYYFILNAE